MSATLLVVSSLWLTISFRRGENNNATLFMFSVCALRFGSNLPFQNTSLSPDGALIKPPQLCVYHREKSICIPQIP